MPEAAARDAGQSDDRWALLWRCAAATTVMAGFAGLLSGCTTGGGPPTASARVTPAVAVTTGELEGKWGLASYRNEADKTRTEAQAKAACGNPFVISRGQNGGVVTYVADQAQPQEVFLKTGPDGQVYLGPRGPAGVKQDRLIVSYQSGVLVTQWIDPGVAARYGTMVLVRCQA